MAVNEPKQLAHKMYLSSENLSKRIQEITKEAEKASKNALTFEEIIALPYHGQIVLRFMLNQDEFTLDDLDRYENLLNEITGEEFLTDFMGCVYQKAGINYSGLDQRLAEMAEQFQNEEVRDSIHAAGIRADAATLLDAAGLDSSHPVWEIQAEGEEYMLLLLGKENKKILSAEKPVRITVAEVDSQPCTGLIKGAVFCKKKGISLARVLLNQ